MSEPRDLVWSRFPGNDEVTEPLLLGEALVKEPQGAAMFTPDSADVYGDGSFVQRRPGVKLMTNQAGEIGVVYDLVRIAGTNAAGSRGKDILAGLFLDNGSMCWGGNWEVGALPSITRLGSGPLGFVDAQRTATMTMAGARWVMVRNGNGVSFTQPTYEWNGSGYAVGSFIGPANPDGSPMSAHRGVWHKEQYFILSNQDPRYASRVQPSVRNNPTQNNLTDAFVVEEDGIFQIHGGYSTGDRLFLGRSGALFMLLGATPDKFRIVPISTKYGVAGIRGGDRIGPDQLLVFLTEAGKPSGATAETPAPRNVGVIIGGELKVIGDKMLTSIRASADARTETQVQNWTALRGALMIPKRVTTKTAATALFLSTAEGGFWKWTLTDGVGVACLREAGGTMYMGTADTVAASVIKGFKYFDPTLAADNGTAFTPYISSPPFRTSEKAQIEKITVFVSQTSGTLSQWTAARRLPDGTYETARSMTLAADNGAALDGQPRPISVSYTGPASSGTSAIAQYINGFKISMPTDGVGSKIHKIVISLKSVGK